MRCDWCNEPIEDDQDWISVTRFYRDHTEPEQLARFHVGTCAGEAADYGWKR